MGFIKDEHGLTWDTPRDVDEAFVRYFANLFTKGLEGDIELCIQPIDRHVTGEMDLALEKDITGEEIDEALFQMAPLKAPGPNGLNACFFQNNWATIRNEVCDVIRDIFNSRVMPKELNMTYIAFIPKLKQPISVVEFRPISLCNIIYKLISKVLANRLKTILPQIIAPTQSAFIPGCLISDNVLVAYETLYSMHTGMNRKKRALWR